VRNLWRAHVAYRTEPSNSPLTNSCMRVPETPPDSLWPTLGRGSRFATPAAFFEHWKAMHMTDQRDADQQSSNPEPRLKSKDRFILGAVVFAALIGGLLLYSTRQREEPTNQGGLTSAPETPAGPPAGPGAVPGGKK
jgi:hypothetical protein